MVRAQSLYLWNQSKVQILLPAPCPLSSTERILNYEFKDIGSIPIGDTRFGAENGFDVVSKEEKIAGIDYYLTESNFLKITDNYDLIAA